MSDATERLMAMTAESEKAAENAGAYFNMRWALVFSESERGGAVFIDHHNPNKMAERNALTREVCMLVHELNRQRGIRERVLKEQRDEIARVRAEVAGLSEALEAETAMIPGRMRKHEEMRCEITRLRAELEAAK